MPATGTISGFVTDKTGNARVANASVQLYRKDGTSGTEVDSRYSDEAGNFQFVGLDTGKKYYAEGKAFDKTGKSATVEVHEDGSTTVELPLGFEFSVELRAFGDKGEAFPPLSRAVAGRPFLVRADTNLDLLSHFYCYPQPDGVKNDTLEPKEFEVTFTDPGRKRITVRASDHAVNDGPTKIPEGSSSRIPAVVEATIDTFVSDADRQLIGGHIGVRLERSQVHRTRDQALWIAIRNRTSAVGFHRYRHFIDRVLQMEENLKLPNPVLESRLRELGAHLHGVAAYQVLKLATEIFLLLEAGIRIEDERESHGRFFETESEAARLGGTCSFEDAKEKLGEYLGHPPQLPYITRVVEAAFPEWKAGSVRRDRVLTGKINEPILIELIWSYWNEEGMLAQTMNAVTRRFQNIRGPERDPLAHLEIDPLRPLNNLIWGFIQDEINRLSVKRRAYEYDHEYGLMLYGKALRGMRPADTRSKFLEAFHNLLHLAAVFFKEDNDTTVIADGYPLLNALKEVHLILAQGAHNQFGDMPWTARSEMMLQQWMLSRPEIRDFLQSRAMVPYREAWMPQVDTMKTLQGWTDVTVTHFRDLAVYGEQILLSVRYGDWIGINDEDSAKNWARYWRPEIQGYLHAYRAVTGIDLTNPDTVDATVPAIHLQKRLVLQQQRAR